MLIKLQDLRGIQEGRITRAFRRWKRPTVKAGGTLKTAVGILAIEAVEEIREAQITRQDALKAGFASRKQLLEALPARGSGKLYRIELTYAGADPRNELRRQARLSTDEVEQLRERLRRWDERSTCGPWTLAALDVIAAHPARRAAELAEEIGLETSRFKQNVRKLKELGLTESLEIGYRLSPRGKALRKRVTAR